jgi:putative toxin-antitoxin system antitoxin component (TIGR02293 family)
MAKKVEIGSRKNRQVSRGESVGKMESKTDKYIGKSGSIAIKRKVIAYGGGKLNRMAVSDADKMRVAHSRSYGSNTAIILADATDKPENLMTPIEKMDVVRIGVSKKDLESLKKIAGLDYDQLAKALSVTRATLINKKREEKFNTVLSERIVGLADIYSYGYDVFEDEERFNLWIFRSNKALGGKTPYDLLDNQFGREEVKSIIGRIEFGVYS